MGPRVRPTLKRSRDHDLTPPAVNPARSFWGHSAWGFIMASSAPAALSRRDWLWLVTIWVMAGGGLLLRSLLAGPDLPFFTDTDDAMRMVVVRDFLAGQGWYDLVQHRLNTPFGAEIHWSRLIDLPLAGLIAIALPFTSLPGATIFAGAVWPLVLMALMLYLSARITLHLVGREGLLPALVLPIIAPAILAEFSPGRVDHHNVVVLMVLASLLATLLAQSRSFWAWCAGLIAATSIAIAVEALPGVVATILAFGLAYVVNPGRAANLARFGLGFVIGMLGNFALARPPAAWFDAACDMISPVYVLAGLAVGAAYLLAARLPAPRTAWQRLCLLAVLGLAAVALVIAIYPQCLAGPYAALDPWLRDNWIAAIVEAKPWHRALFEIPAFAIGIAVPVLLGLVVAVVAWQREPERRLEWLILITFIICTAFIMLAQVRGARLAVLPGVPAAAWLIIRARSAYIARPGALQIGGLLLSWLAASGLVVMLATGGLLGLFTPQRSEQVAQALANRQSCLAASAFADLAALPPERIMTPIDLGAHMLLQTPHAVVSAPYHRNQQGLLDTFHFFNGPADEARAIAEQRGLGLLVTCDPLPEMRGPGRAEAGTMLNLLAEGTPPDWLADVSLGGPLRVYAILP